MNQSMDRRTILRTALFYVPLSAALGKVALAKAQKAPDVGTGPFTLPALPYKFDALEPFIDRKTMEIHHDKHHATYVKNLNDAVTKTPELAGKSPEQLIMMLDQVPEAVRTAVRNNAGGHVNHTMFWAIMEPVKGRNTAAPTVVMADSIQGTFAIPTAAPTGALAEAIRGTFGSMENFQTAFNEAGAKRFGSGWVWLAKDKDGKLTILSTPNQDNPMMTEYGGLTPILGNDIWEHAYYLKYQNRRADYLKAWWNTVNWGTVNSRFAAR